MSDDRKVIKVSPEVFSALKSQKGQFETWDQFAAELAELAEEYHDPPTLDDE